MRPLEIKDKTVFVTGAAGFIGAAVSRELLRTERSVRVIGLDNLNDYYDVNIKRARLKPLMEDGRFLFIEGDLADKEQVLSVFETYRPELVVHLGAQAGVRYSIENPDAYIASNLIGFYHMIEGCRRYPVSHFLFASSSSVYGNGATVPYRTDEKADSPVSLYAATKKADELMAYSYASLYGIPSTGLRFFTVYGPMGRPDMAYFSFTDKLLGGKKIQLFNYGDCLRDFTYIDDIVDGLVRVLKGAPESRRREDGSVKEPPFALYNLGNYSPVKLSEFVSVLKEELVRAGLLPEDYDLSAHVEYVPMQPGDVQVTCADTSDLERDFGFKPSTPIREGLRSFAGWYREFYGKRAVSEGRSHQ